MKTEKPETSGEYMLFYRGADWDKRLSPDELQRAMDKLTKWIGGLQEQGKVRGGQPLGSERKIVSGRNGRILSDGPFAESKEAVGGYLTVGADSLDEAVAIAKACPSLEYGVTIEVRPVLGECPVFQRLREQSGRPDRQLFEAALV
jgi:hypothetical protein